MPTERLKKYALISEITDINVQKFPKKFPMFLLCTEETLNTYNSLMIKAMANGFDPKIRKICFTLGCTEGFRHSDIYEMAKELEEVSDEKYVMLDNIVHWNPIEEAMVVLERFLILIESFEEKATGQEMKDIVHKAMKEARELSDV